jgi:hypothetical protein
MVPRLIFYSFMINTSQPDNRAKWAVRAPALFTVWVLAGCGTIPPSVRDYGAAPDVPELVNTPSYSQQQYQCGPAALMTVLTASGVVTTLDDLVTQVYLSACESRLASRPGALAE